MRHIKLSHELLSARYNEGTGKWALRIRGPSGEEFDDTADFFFTGMGTHSRWKWPEIEGLDTFQGTLIHSAQFEVEEGFEWKDKKVGVIGVVRFYVPVCAAIMLCSN